MAPFVVVISGSTRTGKTTLSQGLALLYSGSAEGVKIAGPATLYKGNSGLVIRIAGDDFFDREVIKHRLKGNYDHPDAINHTRILTLVKAHLMKPEISMIIFEGFMAFHDDALMELANARVWLCAPHHVVRERRRATQGVCYKRFDAVIWPNHLRYEERVFDPARIIRLGDLWRIDSEQPKELVLSMAVDYISQLDAMVIPRSDQLLDTGLFDAARLPKRKRSLNQGELSAKKSKTSAKPPAPKGDAYIVSHGSFNPPHRGHVMMFEAARARLELEGYHVMEGVMGLTCKSHILTKGAPALADDVRTTCCDAILSECGANWIHCDPTGVRFRSGRSMINNYLQKMRPGVTGFNLIGGDVAERFAPGSHAIVADRAGSRPAKENTKKHIYVVELDADFGRFSSTAVRKARVEGNEILMLNLVGRQMTEILKSLPSSSFQK